MAEVTETETTPQTIQDLQPKMKLIGKVKRLELYGAFIDLGVDTDALIHISKLGKDRVNRVADVLNQDEDVTVWVESVDTEKNQIMVTMIEPLAVDWKDLEEGQTYTGTITRLENFGAFVSIGAEREGLVHISELSHDYVKHPSEVLSVGAEVQTKVLGFSKRKRRIDLSIKALLDKPEQEFAQAQDTYDDYNDEVEEEEVFQTAMEIALRQALGSDDDDGRSRKKKKGNPKKKARRSGGRYRSQQDDLLDRTLNR
jgi:ribosomal protein S1